VLDFLILVKQLKEDITLRAEVKSANELSDDTVGARTVSEKRYRLNYKAVANLTWSLQVLVCRI